MGIPSPLLSSPRGLAGGREKEEDFYFLEGGQVGSVGAGLGTLQLQPDQDWIFPLVFTDTNSHSRQPLPAHSCSNSLGFVSCYPQPLMWAYI